MASARMSGLESAVSWNNQEGWEVINEGDISVCLQQNTADTVDM